MGIKKVRIFDAEPGMILAKPVVVLHSKGRELMSPGSMIEKKHITRLDQWGIEHIYIETPDEDYEVDLYSESIRFLAKQTYEDAISSLTKLSRSLVDSGDCEIGQVTKSISQILNVISLEEGLLSLLSKIKESEEYIYQHNVDVCVTALILGRALELSEDSLLMLGAGCLLHDMGLPRYKKAKWDNCMLTGSQANIRKHPLVGLDIARTIAGIEPEVLDIVSQHHEYMDGSGYPNGISGDDISLLARITAISEAYNTLVGPYDPNNALDPHKATAAIMDPRHHRFDPEIMRAFVNNMAIYPTGTFVRLSTNFRAVVVSGNKGQPLRPCVLALYDRDNKPIKPFHIDLAKRAKADVFIEEVVDSSNVASSIEQIVGI